MVSVLLVLNVTVSSLAYMRLYCCNKLLCCIFYIHSEFGSNFVIIIRAVERLIFLIALIARLNILIAR